MSWFFLQLLERHRNNQIFSKRTSRVICSNESTRNTWAVYLQPRYLESSRMYAVSMEKILFMFKKTFIGITDSHLFVKHAAHSIPLIWQSSTGRIFDSTICWFLLLRAGLVKTGVFLSKQLDRSTRISTQHFYSHWRKITWISNDVFVIRRCRVSYLAFQ